CQRNVEYGAGWDALTAIANPHSGGINTSAMVGQYNDPEGEPWLPLVADFGGPMDLSTRNILKVKLWSSMAVPMLFKLEGGVSPAKEVWQDITTTGEWVEYTIDFSDQAAANHEKLSIFFNGGVDAGPNDVYYIDDIVFEEAPAAPALEDFEPQKMGWGPAGGNATEHGSFAVVANPDMTGVNTSANVGEYTKGTAEYSTLAAVFPAGLDLSTKPQLNLQVWAPAGATSVIMKLSSPLQGFKEVTQDISATETWVDMGFNFEAFSDITDFESVNLIFNPGTAEAGVKFLFDNLTQSESTVDPCMGVAPIPNIINDFECQVNYSIGAGNDRLTTVNNPHVTAENNSTKVGEYLDPNDEWSALGFESGSSWDLSVYNQFKIKIYSSAIVPLLFKLEGGTSPAKEVSMQVTEVDKWVEYTVDFSDQAMEDHARIVVFFNAGVNPGQEDTYYIDDVLWQRANYSGCVGDYESPNTTFMHQYFANGHIEQEDNKIHTVDNPAPGGINTSTTVAKFVRASDCDPWAGAFSPLGAPIEFGANKTIRVKVYMDHIGNFGMKTEASATGAANIELSVPNTKVNEWEELTFDFSAAPDDAQFMTLTVFVDLGIDATGVDVTSYFDDIIIGDGSCLPDGLFTPTDVASFELSPNPVSTELRIDNLEDLRQLSITNLLGQVVSTIKTSNNTTASFDVSQLKSGIYFLTGYDNNGQLIANAKFVKE
ncbi:MAG TPA: T9SS type A sorting domain-containing protein, partial [Saprospiraceae bacterium]|nr:T9SS type A sorting domain-containing protein [Saprospiraceae bacterium]